jgi:hypothetical protein
MSGIDLFRIEPYPRTIQKDSPNMNDPVLKGYYVAYTTHSILFPAFHIRPCLYQDGHHFLCFQRPRRAKNMGSSWKIPKGIQVDQVFQEIVLTPV